LTIWGSHICFTQYPVVFCNDCPAGAHFLLLCSLISFEDQVGGKKSQNDRS